MNKKVILDTGVWISYFGREENKQRTEMAKNLFKILSDSSFEILFSQRTENELNQKPSLERQTFLKKFDRATYYKGNETWNQIQGTWENIGSLWESSEVETTTAIKIKNWLKREKDIEDRGILLDAVFNGCKFFIHENPNDFNKISLDFWEEFDIQNINLLEIEFEELEKLLG
jgi:predicted nucleic acid-binding protein